MKTGVICDGISRDLDHALTVMSEFDLEYAELQFVWDKELVTIRLQKLQRSRNY